MQSASPSQGAWDLEALRGPCDLWAFRIRTWGGNFTSTEHIFFLPWFCFLVFLSLCYCLILWFDFWRMVGGAELSNTLGMRLSCDETGLPHLSNRLWVCLKQGRHKYKGEQGRTSFASLYVWHPRPAHSRHRMNALRKGWSFYLNSSVFCFWTEANSHIT